MIEFPPRVEVYLKAVIESGGRQFRVESGQIIRVPKLEAQASSEIKIDKVMLVIKGEETKIGAPYVNGAYITAKVVGNVKEKKVINFKYKPKKGYHRKVGHRQENTEIEIKEIVA